MIKAFVCILIYSWPGSSYGPTSSTVDNLARVEDCHRVGRAWKTATDSYGTYRCVEVYKVK